jgi:DNA-directed RNA polymerase subunit RPC12/RpoP
MGRYPRTARDARIKCIPCNAPVTRTIEGKYVCVECGNSPIEDRVDN